MKSLAAVALLIASLPALAQEPVRFPTPARENPVDSIQGRVWRPDGAGPHPAVVLMHGCNGPSRNIPDWAERLRAQGYVALEVDGFGPRGIDELCTRAAGDRRITARDRAWDAHGGLAWLQSQPGVDGRRVALMGFSHGGSTALVAASGAFLRQHPGKPDFAAVVPMYPGCFESDLDATMPTLVLAGERDDWTPSAPCERKAARARASGHDVRIVVLPGAHHAFDSPDERWRWLPAVRNGSKPGGCCGAAVAGSREARERAEREVFAFLAAMTPAGPQPAQPLRPLPMPEAEIEKTVRAVAALAPEAMLEEVNEHGGRFEGNRFHVFVLGLDGRYLAHARYPYAIGQKLSAKDNAGRPLLEHVRAATAADGWGGYLIGPNGLRFYAIAAGERIVVGLRY